ncbi:transglycosylase family protein [Nocardioides sp. YIM 152588]|uniref:resuscitation-promoting factor n=1 Tax=Nocardioides sp. YIM 152588 TaxID=3158259 RepID=UPI0032E4F19E
MPMRTITRAVRGGASAIVAGALVVGVGVSAAQADTGTSPAAAESTTEPTADPTTDPTTDPTDPAAEPVVPATTRVRLKVGNRDVRRVRTEASRPKGLLTREGVKVDRDDEVLVVRNGKKVTDHDRRVLRDGDKVRVVRVGHRIRIHRVKVDRATHQRAVTSLAPGKRKLAQRGRDGVRKVRVRIDLRNGNRVDRTVRKSWIRKPKPRVVLVGKAQTGVPGTAGLNWAALARCESGGNPRAVNPAGYYGLYQFNVATWRSVGGAGMPHLASPAEQTFRAKKLYASRGRSPWPYCGRFL